MRNDTRKREEPAAAPSACLVRSQLDRILSSDLFTRSERLTAFLRYVVEQTLDGHSTCLKEQILGAELYGKGPEFAGSTDPIVRVDARRLRDKLREYYAQFPRDPVLISLPKGSYVPTLEENTSHNIPGPALPDAPEAIPVTRRLPWRWLIAAVMTAAAIGALVSWLVLGRRAKPGSHAVPIASSFYGVSPGISPDGRFIAFSSKGPEESGKPDIWVRTLDSGALRRLTETPQFTETFPAWSPDGRQIAFMRDGEGIFVVPESGGVERRVSSGTWADWAPDGKSLIIRDRENGGPFAMYQLFLETLKRRRLTEPQRGEGDWRSSISPDGSRLAFVRLQPGDSDLYVVPMRGGEPRRVTNWNAGLTGVVWTPDGQELIYSKEALWRISANLTAPGRGSPLDGDSLPANNLSISRPLDGHPARLVFQTYSRELSFRLIDLTAPLYDGVFQAVKPFAPSSRLESPGPFSADSRYFAFVSSQPPQIWVSDTEGAGLRQIASLNTYPVLGSWSPDGKKLVYTSAIDGKSDIFVVDTISGSVKRLTFGISAESFASWSRDGRWIYFSCTQSGATPDVWRIPEGGGASIRITYHGGVQPRESPDGKSLYFIDLYPPPERMGRPIGTARLMQVPAGGGSETALLEALTPDWWSLADSGIYFISREPGFDAIDRYSFRDRKVIRAGRLAMKAGQFGGQMHVSPDGRWALVTTHRATTGLMLVDNLR